MPFLRFCGALCVTTVAALSSAASTSAPESAPLGKAAFELIDNRIFVNVTINGHGPFHMILDTGASLGVSPEVAQKAGLKSESSAEVGGVGEKSVKSQNSHVRELSFGPVHLSNVECDIISTADSTYVFGKVPVDGFLGAEVFEEYVVLHDYQKKELTFYLCLFRERRVRQL